MKKVFRVGLLSIASLMFLGSCSSDDDSNGIPVEQGTSSILPNTARSFVAQYFDGYSYAEVKKLSTPADNGAVYVANMKEGTQIQFDSDGQWVDIDGKNQPLPDLVTNLLPATALNYVEQNYATTTKSTNSKLAAIIKLLRLKYGYQVDLQAGDALMFDNIGEFLSNQANTANNGSANKGELPAAASNFIATNLSTESYLYIAQLNIPVYGTIYNVYLSNGYKVKFDKDGQFKEIDRDDKAIPSAILTAILPQVANSYISSKYANIGVESVEVKTDRYEVELLNDFDLIFDLQGNLIGSDNDDDNDDQKVDASTLPQTAIDFIASAFPNANGYKEVKKNKVADDGVMYEVRLNDDTQLELDVNGNWLEVKAKRGILPQTFINTLASNIVNYLNKNQSGIGVEQVSLDRKGYEVELINGIEIEFDLNGNFVSIDR